MENILYRKDHILLLAQYGNPEPHRHFAKHILVSDRPFACTAGSKAAQGCSMVIQSQVLHAIKKDPQAAMVVFLIDESSQLSRQIDGCWLMEKAAVPLPKTLEEELIRGIRAGRPLEELDDGVCRQLQGPEPPPPDDRVAAALGYIEASEDLGRELYEELSRQSCLSKSRFLHLFKEQVGMDLRNYLLMKRMEKVYQGVTQEGMSITEAAVRAGFSSSSHFSVACKKHYGISLTDFLRSQSGPPQA